MSKSPTLDIIVHVAGGREDSSKTCRFGQREVVFEQGA